MVRYYVKLALHGVNWLVVKQSQFGHSLTCEESVSLHSTRTEAVGEMNRLNDAEAARRTMNYEIHQT